MATVQNLFDVAVQRSNLNDADLLPTAEILRLVSVYEKRVFRAAARKNPDYFGREGNTSARAASTDTWSLTSAPGNVASVSRVEVAAITGTVSGLSVGTEVNIISLRNPLFAFSPRAYIRNKTVHEYNSELQTDSSNFVTRLKIFYSFLPSTRTAMSDVLDIPEELESLVVLPLAMVLATRDQRPDEVPGLLEEFKLDWEVFLSEVESFDEGSIRPLAAIEASA